MGGHTRRQAPQKGPKVGDVATLPPPSNYVRLPDGTVVTARTTYRFANEGKHVVINASTGETVRTVTVTAK